MEERKKLIGNRKYKDRLFRMLFSDKDKLLELYNALNKSSHTDSDDLEITTDGAVQDTERIFHLYS